LVVTLNPSFSQDKLREGPVLSEVEGSQVRENMRFFPFAEPVLEDRSERGFSTESYVDEYI